MLRLKFNYPSDIYNYWFGFLIVGFKCISVFYKQGLGLDNFFLIWNNIFNVIIVCTFSNS